LLDGSMSRGAALAFGAAIIGVNIYSARRYRLVPKRAHLRDPRGARYAAFWNFLSEQKWTADGVEFHRRYMAFLAKVAAGLVVLWIMLGRPDMTRIARRASI
jgi:hypothetical protein